MPDTRLILHVKGTEAETRELPKAEVQAAVAEGRLSDSQLIWSVNENTWKPVRDLPELHPGETLILHVKGTESETRHLPKEAVKDAISRGEISHSQLIWSPHDSAWKQVREIPDLLPGETMILHVKGTESETRELPKVAIRAAISKGEITHSQLIWSPLDTTWMPVSQMPELMPGESLILHVKGTSSDTTEMPKKAIRTAIKAGQITHSQLIWSAGEHQWKQVRELPELLPSQKLAPAPARKVMPVINDGVSEPPRVTVPTVAVAANDIQPRARPTVTGPPRVQMTSASTVAPPRRDLTTATAPAMAAAPRVNAAAAPVARASVTSTVKTSALNVPVEDHVIEEENDHIPLVKWICIGMGGLLALILAANYFLVDQRLQSRLAHSSFAEVGAYAHYGAFLQPNVIVIHIPASTKLTSANLPDYLATLAHATPDNLLTNDLYERVALTSGWTAQYSFSGNSWKQLGDMPSGTGDERRNFIMAQMSDAGGHPMTASSMLNEEAQAAHRDKAWQEFAHHFTKP